MIIAQQLEFFVEQEDQDYFFLKQKVESIETTTNKVRKSLYAENGAIKKQLLEQSLRLEILERHICKGVVNECDKIRF